MDTQWLLVAVALGVALHVTTTAAAAENHPSDVSATHQEGATGANSEVARLWADVVAIERERRSAMEGDDGEEPPQRSPFKDWLVRVFHKVFKPAGDSTGTQYGKEDTETLTKDDAGAEGSGTGVFGRFVRWLLSLLVGRQQEAGGRGGAPGGRAPGRRNQQAGGGRTTTADEDGRRESTTDRAGYDNGEGEELEQSDRDIVSDDWEGK